MALLGHASAGLRYRVRCRPRVLGALQSESDMTQRHDDWIGQGYDLHDLMLLREYDDEGRS